MGLSITILVLLLMAFVLITRIAPAHQRYAWFDIGKYQGLKGPGLVFKWPWSSVSWTRLGIGDQGEFVEDGPGKFNGLEIPIETFNKIEQGSKVRISGFTESKVQVVPDPDKNTVTD
jgi:hypothetical protein